MRSIKKLTLTPHVVNFSCHEGKTSRINVILSLTQLMLWAREIWNRCHDYGKVVQDAGKYETGAKRGKTHARQKCQWVMAFSEAIEYVVHTLSNEKWFPSKYHGSLWEVGWSGPWWLSILCCGLELLKINNINEIIELLKIVKGSHLKEIYSLKNALWKCCATIAHS